MANPTLHDDLGKLVLRLTLGGLMLPHGVHKLGTGVGRLADNVANHGLPRFVAYGVYVGEVIAPLLIIVGLATRPAAAVFAFNMVVAVWLAHAADVFTLNPRSGGYALELQALYMLGAVAVALLGAGRFAVLRGNKWWS